MQELVLSSYEIRRKGLVSQRRNSSARVGIMHVRGVHGRVGSCLLNIKSNHLCWIFKSINQTIKLGFLTSNFFGLFRFFLVFLL